MEYAYLAHHGIKGMRWGVRRYQNADGSLTEAGKKHYRTNLDYQISITGSKKSSKSASDYKAVKDVYNNNKNNIAKVSKSVNRIKNSKKYEMTEKEISKMSDDELRRRVNRLNLEKQYKNLTGTGQVLRGQDYVRESIEIIGGLTGIAVSAATIYAALKNKKVG